MLRHINNLEQYHLQINFDGIWSCEGHINGCNVTHKNVLLPKAMFDTPSYITSYSMYNLVSLPHQWYVSFFLETSKKCAR